MPNNQLNLKINVDTAELDVAIEKAKNFAELHNNITNRRSREITEDEVKHLREVAEKEIRERFRENKANEFRFNGIKRDGYEDLYCAMLHLACFTEDAKYERVANFTKPCEICRLRDLARCDLNYYRNISALCDTVGIVISPCTTKKLAYSVHSNILDRY